MTFWATHSKYVCSSLVTPTIEVLMSRFERWIIWSHKNVKSWSRIFFLGKRLFFFSVSDLKPRSYRKHPQSLTLWLEEDKEGNVCIQQRLPNFLSMDTVLEATGLHCSLAHLEHESLGRKVNPGWEGSKLYTLSTQPRTPTPQGPWGPADTLVL